MAETIAIIDCGTNTFHLLIARFMEEAFETIHAEKVSVRVGKGGIKNKTITEDAITRATDTISHFARIIKSHPVDRTYAFATSAFRNAANAESVRKHLFNETGVDIRIISGDEEAEFIFWGVNSALDLGHSPVLVVDIGGGSVEFIIGFTDHILWKYSFEIGAQRLLDMFHHTDPIREEEVEQLEAYLDKNLEELLRQLKVYDPQAFIGSSGTFDTLSDIYCHQHSITAPAGATETPLSMAGYREIHAELLAKTSEERRLIPGMVEMRVDMIVVASCLIHFIMKKHNFQAIRVSTQAMKEGVLDRIIKGKF